MKKFFVILLTLIMTMAALPTQPTHALFNSEKKQYAKLLKKHLPIITEKQLKLDGSSYDYIVDHYKWFPAKSTKDIASVKKATKTGITSKHLNKNVSPYLKNVVSFTGVIVSIDEEQVSEKITLTTLHVMDENENSYQVLYYNTTKNMLEDDIVQFWGVPLGRSSFPNVSGGTTLVQVFMGSYIAKIK